MISARRAVTAACVVAAVLAVPACGGSEPESAPSASETPSSTPSGPPASTPDSTPATTPSTTPAPAEVPLGRTVTKQTAEQAVRAGGLTNADVAPSEPRSTPPQLNLRGATLANMCDVKHRNSLLVSDQLRLARKQIWWTVAAKAWVSEERVVYRPGGVRAALADIRLAAGRVCPKRLGTEPSRGPGLPAGSVDLWIKDTKQTKQYMYAQVVPVSPNMLIIVWGGADSFRIHEIVRARHLKAMKSVVQRAQPAVRILAG